MKNWRDEEEELLLRDIKESFPFEKDIRSHYIQFEESVRRPDLLGKTVKITKYQYQEVYWVIERLANQLEMEMPDVYVIEDYYYGTQSAGIDKPWIEISAKTISDCTEKEITFLLGKELATIKLGYTEWWTLINKQKNILSNSIMPGKELAVEVMTIKFAKWQRLTHYTTDCIGINLCRDIGSSISAVLMLILNNRSLVERIHLPSYLKQAEEINLLNTKVHQYTKADETVPYGPFRVKQLLARYNEMGEGVL